MKKINLIFIFIFILFGSTYGTVVTGSIKNVKGEALSFSTVYIKELSFALTADYEGKYTIDLKPGNYTLIFNYIGYKTLEKEVEVKKKN